MTLQELRKKIEKIDTIIIENLANRKEISIQIGKLKNEIGKEVYDSDREKQLMLYYEQLSKRYNINPEYIQNIFKVIISNSRMVQKNRDLSIKLS